ncbi:Phosphoenolpyruvate/pyruvate domain-containing protein [Pseudovirgaria hyperparasitica]|uniref:Phosphoenolpyruvate/pyruvate domain-containing protein n=1 Tax=Pseudovirgaria hyperparasitica TaxID=470096 RepID=A0A6A6WET6_9PEZI|nr:Phosphoenolpyruvate/pyruvate domain-containing protein [Pseudovirgaria hyperparasitica]KAF2761332.1 Phosphoenolpyruvate/pyruvate domain-containing protein [Pseudovirgaria hyperparasitica]
MVVAPGVYDGFTARLALNVGFDALYMTGFGTSLSRIGWPDLGLATASDMIANASLIANLDPSIPLIADADTGYGGPIAVARTVSQYIQAGVAAFHLEDQVQTKRCGHLLGKELVTKEEFVSRIKAAVEARTRAQSDIIIIARTDALAGPGFDEAIERLRAAIGAGADVAFLEGIRNEAQATAVCEIMGETPMLLNLVPGGLTPNWSMRQAQDLGFRMTIVPLMLLEASQKASTEALKALKSDGKVNYGEKGPRGLSELCGLKDAMKIDEISGGKALGSI